MRRCRPEESRKVLRAEICDRRLRHEERTGLRRDRRPGRRERGHRRDDRGRRGASEERAEGQHRRGGGEGEEGQLNGSCHGDWEEDVLSHLVSFCNY